MAGQGYSYVSTAGLISFLDDLKNSDWKSIDIAPFVTPDRKLAAGLDAIPSLVMNKIRVVFALEELVEAHAATPEILIPLDKGWDSLQRRLHYRTAEFLEDPDPKKVAAAALLRQDMTSGAGTSQTKLSLEEEVDFGRKQTQLAAQKPYAEAIALLELGGLFSQIGEATEALARGIGRVTGEGKPLTRQARLNSAEAVCYQALNDADDDLHFAIERSPEGPGRERLKKLLATLEALLARHAKTPAPTPVPTSGAPGDA